MTSQQKNEIREALQRYVDEHPSQRRAAETLMNVSEATVIAILSGKWETVSEAMLINVAKQLGIGRRQSTLVETLDFQTLILYFTLAKEEGATFAITGPGGYGKSYAGKWFAQVNRKRNVYYLECAEYWNKKLFLSKLLKAMGKGETGMGIGEMMETIVSELRRQHQPLIILDEVDKLPDPILKFFITLYNELNGMCGFVWTSTAAIQKRIKKGVSANKSGYQELLSRIGTRFLELKGTSPEEVRELCLVNGIVSEEDIHRIINEYNGDLRRVDRNFLKYRAKEVRNQLKRA